MATDGLNGSGTVRHTIEEFCEKKEITLSELARRLGRRQSTLNDARTTKNPHYIDSKGASIELVQVKADNIR